MSLRDEFKVGDRVEGTNANGDEATFTVARVGSRTLTSVTNAYDTEDGWSFTRQARPLPTQAGLYSPDATPGASRYLMLTTEGDLYWVDFTASSLATAVDTPIAPPERYADNMHLVFAYPGAVV